ncbi:methyltransferase domain-containing protein [Mesorhizobium sp. LHD-90]|uniref:class I SAM-dependent methyltransferase n=1 Tax=Mesorhizobium sp. LHD-90 TaxID=3071414 RepID=UPI0027DF568A|nr:methyltransferase domain-containing protein [Mesorhizobium sp. LHD-90]MDQ6437375.1 methyltransferase domain-containing protein [Mesorhizobium sp. LHD-90]
MIEAALTHLQAPFRMNGPEPRPSLPALGQLPLRLRTFRWLLSETWPQAKGKRLLDLGAGPGLFARIASRHGFSVTAVDARMPWTAADIEAGQSSAGSGPVFEDDEFLFIQKDLRDVDDLSGFDVIACIGVLYHLPFADQRDLLARCAARAMVIDTEIYDASRIPESEASRFRPATVAGGYSGAFCREQGQVYSSHGDALSFWFDQDSILRFFADAGCSRVTMVEPQYFSAFGPRRWFVLNG